MSLSLYFCTSYSRRKPGAASPPTRLGTALPPLIESDETQKSVGLIFSIASTETLQVVKVACSAISEGSGLGNVSVVGFETKREGFVGRSECCVGRFLLMTVAPRYDTDICVGLVKMLAKQEGRQDQAKAKPGREFSLNFW